MCGGLVVLNPGSPTQVICGIMIMLFHMLLVLKLAPYIHDSEDWSSFASSLGLTLTFVGALIKMLQTEMLKRGGSKKAANNLYYADIAMDTLPVACVSIVVLIMIFVDCGLWNYMKCKKKNQDDGKKSSKGNGSLTQVQPITVSGDEVDNNNKKNKESNDLTKVSTSPPKEEKDKDDKDDTSRIEVTPATQLVSTEEEKNIRDWKN